MLLSLSSRRIVHTNYKSLKSHYDDRAATWLMTHPGRAINEEMVRILNEAYGKAATVANTVSGYSHAGIQTI